MGRIAAPAFLAAILLTLTPFRGSAQPLALGGDPRVDPADFRVTTFAAGLDFPLGMAALDDGSLLVGLNRSSGPGSSLLGSIGEVVRFVDADRDGVADGPESVLFTGLNAVTSLRVANDLVFVATGAIGGPLVVVLRAGATPADPLTLEGSLAFTLPLPWSHLTFGLAARPAPGAPGVTEVFFNIGSRDNALATLDLVPVTGLWAGSLPADAIHRITIDDTGPALVVTEVAQIATGLRNAVGIDSDPATGDLYFDDNSIDDAPGDPVSVDELNFLSAGQVGGAVEDFGFPDNYVAYRTGVEVGAGGIDPIVTYQPVPPPNGEESKGPVDIALAPRGFPAGLDEGVFVGFHGLFSEVGVANPFNPLVYADLVGGVHFHFVANDEAAVGHLDGLAATVDSLFVADLTNVAGLSGYGTGAIYQIQALTAACDDGVDNDSDGGIDWNGGAAGEPPDTNCLGAPERSEKLPGCGLGLELILLLPLLARGGRRAR